VLILRREVNVPVSRLWWLMLMVLRMRKWMKWLWCWMLLRMRM
jgi:hypothetical protein